jgi:small glutamine-rich tetratricopeptide repeat-containing protein alpha
LALDPNNAALRTGLDNAKAHAETDPEPIRSAPAAGGGGTGMPDLESMMRNMGGAGGPGAGGMPDLAGLMNNPMMRQMAEGMMANGGLERLMQNPAVANMVSGQLFKARRLFGC